MTHTSPTALPAPIDDGACAHLTNTPFPSLPLKLTNNTTINISSACDDLTIIFCYPRTAAPNAPVSPEWTALPGARGCTPQACSFRDLLADLTAAGVSAVYGLSTQSTAYQQEVKERLHLPYELISDQELEVVKALRLPTFEWEGQRLIKRVTLAVSGGRIVRIWYPVFPTEENAGEVLKWVKGRGE